MRTLAKLGTVAALFVIAPACGGASDSTDDGSAADEKEMAYNDYSFQSWSGYADAPESCPLRIEFSAKPPDALSPVKVSYECPEFWDAVANQTVAGARWFCDNSYQCQGVLLNLWQADQFTDWVDVTVGTWVTGLKGDIHAHFSQIHTTSDPGAGNQPGIHCDLKWDERAVWESGFWCHYD